MLETVVSEVRFLHGHTAPERQAGEGSGKAMIEEPEYAP